MAMPNSQHADPETQLEVDEMILDCLLYKATEAVLAEEHNVQCATLPADEVKVTAEIPLNLVDCMSYRTSSRWADDMVADGEGIQHFSFFSSISIQRTMPRRR